MLKIIDVIDRAKKRFVEQMMQERKGRNAARSEEKSGVQKKIRRKKVWCDEKEETSVQCREKEQDTEPPSKHARKAAEPHNSRVSMSKTGLSRRTFLFSSKGSKESITFHAFFLSVYACAKMFVFMPQS